MGLFDAYAIQVKGMALLQLFAHEGADVAAVGGCGMDVKTHSIIKAYQGCHF